MTTEEDWEEVGVARCIQANRDSVLLRSATTGRELWFPRDVVQNGDRLRPGDSWQIFISGSYHHVWQRQLRQRLEPLCHRVSPRNPLMVRPRRRARTSGGPRYLRGRMS